MEFYYSYENKRLIYINAPAWVPKIKKRPGASVRSFAVNLNSVKCSTFLFAVAMFESKRFSARGGPRNAEKKDVEENVKRSVLG